MAIPALTAVEPTSYLPSAAQVTPATGVDGFGDQLTGAITNLQSLQGASGEMAVRAITGNLTDIHQATLAATRAQVTLELVAAVRNKGVDAFNEIMRMQA